MAQEDDLELDTDGGEAQKPKSKSKLLIIITVVVLLLGVSATATLMLTGILSDDQEDNVAEHTDRNNKAGKKSKKTKAPLNYVPMDPPFVVNFNADTDIRFLQITVEVGTRNPKAVDLVKEHRPAIRNSLVMLFGNQDPDTLNTREGKETLRSETLAEIQKVMTEETGDVGVDSVFFTSFVMQ
ncbi:MAG: flagellar basal body-associated FliL family protein [Pseudomonadota bacterium]|nr:flagellar basal body-associated FliL family protein [Pseudomonadota bacterium]